MVSEIWDWTGSFNYKRITEVVIWILDPTM